MDTATTSSIKKMSPQFLVTDFERSIQYYTQVLGFDLEFRYEDFYVSVIKEGYSIHLKTRNSLIKDSANKKDNEDLDIIFSVEGIDGLYEEFLNNSVEFVQLLRQMPYGKEFYVADPDGHIIAFIEEAL